MNEDTKERLTGAGKEILSVRSAKGNLSLAELYDPLAVSRELLSAHKQLDSILDPVFEALVGEKFDSDHDGRSRTSLEHTKPFQTCIESRAAS